jgi:hypothetical protein
MTHHALIKADRIVPFSSSTHHTTMWAGAVTEKKDHSCPLWVVDDVAEMRKRERNPFMKRRK